MNDSTRGLLLASAEKLFADHCNKSVLDAAEDGSFPQQLWQTVCDNGFHLLALRDSGAELSDAFYFLQVAGRHAIPLPLAETLLGTRWTNTANDNLISIGLSSKGGIIDLPWGRMAEQTFCVTKDNDFYADTTSNSGTKKEVRQNSNVAKEARDQVAAATLESIVVDEPVYDLLALSRVSMSTGALNRVLELCIGYIQEREQFGRPLSKFQVLQHELAVMASEVAAATSAHDAACAALHSDRFTLELAAAKARTGEAIGLVTEKAHQLHGAMGFTHEHQLHHFTRRLWAWRDEYGNETWWQARLGHHIFQLGADRAWDFIAQE